MTIQFDNNISLGQFLRQEREKRGITLEQVASATKIGVKQLHSLEADQFSDLPAKPFIRGFVTSYARFIGLDAKEVLTHFNSFIDSKAGERPNRESGHSGYAFEKREGADQSRLILGIVMGSFIVLGGIAMLVLKPSLHSHRHSHLDKLRSAHGESPSPSPALSPAPEASPLSMATPSPLAQASEEAPVVAAAAPPTPQPTVAPTPSVSPQSSPNSPNPKNRPSTQPENHVAPAPSPVPSDSVADPLNSGLGLKPSEIKDRVVVKALESVWVRYRVDDKPMMQFPLRKDRILVLRARQSLILQVGNPASVQLNHNSGGFKSADTLNPILRQNDPTFFFPRQAAESIDNPFPGQSPLSGHSVPSPSTSKQE